MSESRLRQLLCEAPVPDAADAERRGWALVEAAYGERLAGTGGGRAGPRRRPGRPSLPRLAIALAIVTLLAALLLSPAGAAVRDWVDDVFSAGVPDADPGLTEIPGGGRLLVQSPAGPWVVQPDGSRRLLGDYREATWSPRGLFVSATSRRTLTAVEPDGTPHWSLSSPGRVADPRWSAAGLEIAYRARRELRVVDADGKNDRWLDRAVAPIAPAWSPQGLALLAYVGAGGRVRIANTAAGGALASAAALPGIEGLEWGLGDPAESGSPAGGLLLEASPSAVRVRELAAQKLLADLAIGPPRELPLPAGSRVRDAALSPNGEWAAVLVERGSRSAVILSPTAGGPPRTLFATPGRLSELAWSPSGDRVLISWPEADQWLFVPVQAGGRVRAVGEIARQFAPGNGEAGFPRVEGWCCRPFVGGLG
jgi:hypothetical protein